MAHWLSPPLVSGPSKSDKNTSVFYKICDEYCSTHGAINRRTPIFQMWAHVVGELPPINLIGRLAASPVTPTLCTLADSTACFQGVNRPYDDEENGESVLVYVLVPKVSIAYEPSMTCLAKAVRFPENTVCTVQVRPTDPLQIGGIDVSGTVTRIEFVIGDAGSPLLPRDHLDRYRERLW